MNPLTSPLSTIAFSTMIVRFVMASVATLLAKHGYDKSQIDGASSALMPYAIAGVLYVLTILLAWASKKGLFDAGTLHGAQQVVDARGTEIPIASVITLPASGTAVSVRTGADPVPLPTTP